MPDDLYGMDEPTRVSFEIRLQEYYLKSCGGCFDSLVRAIESLGYYVFKSQIDTHFKVIREELTKGLLMVNGYKEVSKYEEIL